VHVLNWRIKMESIKKRENIPEDEIDYRLEFVLNYLMKAMKVKQEKWNKMIAIAENKVNK